MSVSESMSIVICFCFAFALLGVGDVGSAAKVVRDVDDGLVKKDVNADCCPDFCFFVGVEGAEGPLDRFLGGMLAAR